MKAFKIYYSSFYLYLIIALACYLSIVMPYSLRAQRIQVKPKVVKAITPDRLYVGDMAAKSRRQNQYTVSDPTPLTNTNHSIRRFQEANEPVMFIPSDTTVLSYPSVQSGQPPVYKDAAIFNFKYLDVLQGMNSSYVQDLMIDSLGFLWFATNGGGVTRYDGNNFFHFTTEAGLLSNRIFQLYEDRNGNIWFATQGGGLVRFDGDKFFIYDQTSGLSSSSIYCITEDVFGNLIIGGLGNHIQIVRGEKIFTYQIPEEFEIESVNQVLYGSEGYLWFTTDKGFFNSRDGLLNFFQFQDHRLTKASSWGLIEDARANIWIATFQGMVKYDREEFFIMDSRHGLGQSLLLSVYEDHSGEIWFGSYGHGLYNYDGKYVTHYDESDGLSLDYIWSIIERPHGTLWLGTDGGGATIFTKEPIRFYTEKNDLTNSYVLAIEEQDAEKTWLASYGGGITIFEDNRVSYLNSQNGLPGDFIYALASDSLDRIWIGFDEKGFCLFEDGYLKCFGEDQGFSPRTVRSILVDSKGRVWLGTETDGVILFDGDLFHYYGPDQGLPLRMIRSISEGPNGKIYFTSDGQGVGVYDEGDFSLLTTKDGLCSNIIVSSYVDRAGNIWFGSESAGVSIYDGKTFERICTDHGLPANSVYSIVEDNSGQIWMGTNKGLAYITNPDYRFSDPSYPTVNPTIEVLDGQNGLKSIDFFPNSVLRSTDGDLWWGGGKNVTKIDFENFRLHNQITIKPTAYINQVKLNGESIDYRHTERINESFRFEEVSSALNYPTTLIINPAIEQINIDFGAIEWLAPQKITYSSRLQGYDENWSAPQSYQSREYKNLPSGEYTFMVRAKSASGIFSEPVSFRLIVRPSWYETWWAALVMILLFIGLLYIIITFRTGQLRKRKRELEDEIRKATDDLSHSNEELSNLNNELTEQRNELEKALTDLKRTQKQLLQSEKMASVGVLSAGMAHEINNPLNFIQGGVYSIQKQLEESSTISRTELQPFLEAIQEGVKRSSTIVRSLNHFSRQGSSYDEICDIHQIINNCLVMIGNEAKYKLTVHRNFTKSPFELRGNEGQLHQAVLNLLSNAEQAIDESGDISIITEVIGKNLILRVIDNGEGMDAETLSKINDPFFTTKEPGKGTGLGVSITYSIVENHGGSITFESGKGRGTEVIVKLPVTKL